MKVAIAWLRHDLRLADNPLFRFAVPPEQLLCVYVLDEAWLAPLPGVEVPRIGPARLRFLWQSLIALRGELLRRGSDLLVRVGDPVEVVAGLAARHAADQVRVRRDAGRDESRQVQRLAERMGEGVDLWQSDGGMLLDEANLPMPLASLPPGFSAFRRKAERDLAVPAASPAPVTLPPWPDRAPRGLPPLARVCDRAAGWRPDARGAFGFQGGEEAGLARLGHYLASGAVARYRQTRNGLAGPDFST